MTLPRLTLERRRALELLATIPHGVNEELLIHGQGFKRQPLVGLIRVGLATPHQARAFSSRDHPRLHAPRPSHHRANLEPTYLAADTCRMTRKPEAPPLSTFDV